MNYAIKRNRRARIRLIRLAAIMGVAIMAVSGAHECSAAKKSHVTTTKVGGVWQS